MTGFVHLHVHSEYSLADGIVRIAPLAATSARYGMPAVALTDWSNVHGMVKFYRACVAVGVKPLVGCDVWVENPLTPGQSDRMILLCRNHRGYRNLGKLLTDAYLRPRKVKVVLAWADLQTLHDDLLVLWDDHEGPLAKLPNQESERAAAPLLEKYQQLFGDRLYFQISRIGHAGEQTYIRRAARLAASHGIGLVATNRVEFIAAEEFDAHEIRVCINDGRTLQDERRPRRFTARQYLTSADEMIELFADLPQAIANTVEVAKRCNLFFDFEDNFLPDYTDASGDPVDQILRRQAEQGLYQRLGIEQLADDQDALAGAGDIAGKEYVARLNHELGVISEMGYPGYFLIVADFIHWAKTNDIPVGPGRGSGAGSLVAWAIGITEIDPLRYSLLFERFLNPERVSLPDFDIDFCVEGRDRVIAYVADRYGRDQVAQVITFGTMAAKAVVRDVGRVMGLPYGFVDQVAKLIPFEIGMTLDKALKDEEQLGRRYREESEIRELIDNARQLEGIARNVSTHAGGVVIAPRALFEYTPLYADTNINQAITQLDKDDLEAIGLVKFDFLGLRTLTIIDSAVKMINRQRSEHEPVLDMKAVPLDDPGAYRLIQSGRTTAIFQIESRGIRELIVRLQPHQFDDLVALVALYRPGPLKSGMVKDFIARKHGREPITYLHDDIAPILEPTYGVIVYQEQVMQIAQVLAGYTLGGSDLLRVAMGKKKKEEMNRQRAVFHDGAVERGVKPAVAKRIFEFMEHFAGYGFNKSHSVAYALVAYHTAWLKAHHPAAFMAATLSSEHNNTDKVVILLNDCKELDITVLPPDINAGSHGFKPTDQRTILYGLSAVKGVGKGVSESIEAERQRNGKFEDLFDMCRRLPARALNKRVLEALIKSGAMDELGAHRAALIADIDSALQAAEQQLTSQQTGQADMFGVVEAPKTTKSGKVVEPWSEQDRLAAEKETLGLYLTGHPYSQYRAELAEVTQKDLRALDLTTPKTGLFAGLVFSIRIINTRRGKMGFVMLDNASERVEVILYSEQFQHCRSILQKDNTLVVYGEFSIDEFTGGVQMRAETVADIDTFRSDYLRRIHIDLAEQRLDAGALQSLRRILHTARGGKVGITVHYQRTKGESGTIKLGPDWAVHPSRQLINALTERTGDEHIRFKYETSSFGNGTTARIPERPRLAAMG